MPPKRKDFLKPSGKSKAKAQDPQSENDFLEAADEHEQAAGKWRAGDAAKATRFFNRAIDMYNAGLQRYPNSFDLAYNKANLEYNMSEDDRIVAMLGDKRQLLEETLNSHRVALALDSDNSDVVFNTGQVLTSLAEAVLESGTQEAEKVPATMLLEEAVDLFTKCLASQQLEYEQIQAEIAKAKASQENDDIGQAGYATQVPNEESMETSSTSSDAPGEWATVVEPVTPETILETCIAQLGALTTLLGLYDPSDLPAIEIKAQSGLDTVNTKIPALINLILEQPSPTAVEEPAPGPTLSISSSISEEEAKPSPKDEALLAAANFQSSIAEATYRSHQITTVQYAKQIEQIFSDLVQASKGKTSGTSGVNALSAYADSLIDLASAISDGPHYNISSPKFIEDLEYQWTALTQAQTTLTQLSSPPHTTTLASSRLSDIFSARGDIDLFRFRISLFETAKPAWAKSRAALVSNAGVYYRGARSYAEKAGAINMHKTADAKAIIAGILKDVISTSGSMKESWRGKEKEVLRMLEQMVEEGIVGRENTEGITKIVEEGH